MLFPNFMGRAQVCYMTDFHRAFVECFCMSAYMWVLVCDEIDDALPNQVMISHLLCALLF